MNGGHFETLNTIYHTLIERLLMYRLLKEACSVRLIDGEEKNGLAGDVLAFDCC